MFANIDYSGWSLLGLLVKKCSFNVLILSWILSRKPSKLNDNQLRINWTFYVPQKAANDISTIIICRSLQLSFDHNKRWCLLRVKKKSREIKNKRIIPSLVEVTAILIFFDHCFENQISFNFVGGTRDWQVQIYFKWSRWNVSNCSSEFTFSLMFFEYGSITDLT